MRFHDFRGRGFRGLCRHFEDGMMPLKKPLLDSSWLLSSIHRIWRLGWLARLGCLAAWLFNGFSWISIDFFRFHGFQGSGVSRHLPTFANGMMPLKKPLLDPSWLLFHRFSWISEDFIDSSIHRIIGSGGWAGWLGWAGLAGWLFHRFSWISGDFMRFHGFQGSGVSRPLPTFADEMLPLKKPLLDPS